MTPPGMGLVDYIIFTLMLLGTLGIAVYHAVSSRKKGTTTEYLVGGRDMNVLAVSISLMVSFISSIMMLGFPAETYTNGGMYWLYAAGIAIGAILAAVVFIPVFHPLQLTSVNQYLKLRFHSQLVAILGTLSGVASMILYTAIVYFAPATAIEAVTGFPTWASILLGSVIAVLYTTIGGIKAVIWTDVFQTFIMVAGLLAVTIQAVLKVGGLSTVWDTCDKWGRMRFLDFNPDPTVRFTFWSLTLGVGVTFLNIYGTTQTAVQRYSSVSTLSKARLCIILALPWTTLMVSLACLSGLAMFAYYALIGCDPLRAKFISNPNQLIPYFVMDTLRLPGLPGILLAGLCAASLSTASSALNAAAANVWDDILHQVWPDMPEKRNLLVTKLLVVVFGVLSACLGFLVQNLGGTVMQVVVTFLSASGSPTTAMFLLGVFCPWANWIGVSIGGVVGFIFGIWKGLGAYSISKHKDFLPTSTVNCSIYKSSWFETSSLDFTTEELTSSMMFDIEAMTTESSREIFTTVAPDQEGFNFIYWLYSVSYLWISLFSMVLALVVGIVVSLITGGMRGKPVDNIYLHPLVRCLRKADSDSIQDKSETHKDKYQHEKAQHSYSNPALDMGNGMNVHEKEITSLTEF